MQFEVLAVVVDLLGDAGIPHVLAGSFASTFHGAPRMTRDINLIVDPTTESLQRFVDVIDRDRFYVGDAFAAFERRDMFNLVDTATGWKVDLIMRRERAFSIEEFERRTPVTIGGVETFVASAEDTVLAKLEWFTESNSQRQFEDARAIAVVQQLDRTYLDHWARELGVSDLVQRILDAAEEEKPRS